MSDLEYRLTWRRAGLGRHHRLYQSRPPAEHYALILQGRLQEATGLNPDDYACCPGHDCGCGGMSNADAWAERALKIPPLIEGPVISARIVGEWDAA